MTKVRTIYGKKGINVDVMLFDDMSEENQRFLLACLQRLADTAESPEQLGEMIEIIVTGEDEVIH